MTNEEAKQQAIKNAYVEYWDIVKNHVDDKGWLINYWMYNENVSKLNHDFRTNKNLGYGYFDVRPKQLQGIENNNGWINASDKLPTEFGFYHVEVENNEQDLLAYFNLELKTWSLGVFEFNIKKWQPINYPKKSIY